MTQAPPRQTQALEATFNYIAASERTFKPVKIQLKNGRERSFRLRGEGMELLKDVYLPINNFFIPAMDLRRQLQDQMNALARRLTGAHTTSVFLPLVRSEAEAAKQKNAVSDTRTHINSARPHDIVHNDYGVGFKDFLQNLSPSKLRYFLGASHREYPSDEDLVKTIRSAKRVVVVQFWASAQPEGTVIEHHPLAICAPRSVKSKKHILPIPLPEYGGVNIGENFDIYLANAECANEHEWYYFPNMTRHEMLSWVGYDSLEDPLLPPFHSAFELPKDRDGQCPRESVEVRVLCLLDHTEPFFPQHDRQSSL